MIKTLSGCLNNTHKTERFCALVDHNIMLFVETLSDGSEKKTCQHFKECEKKNKCRYSISNYNQAAAITQINSAN